jgi:hypothetical protein
MSDRDQPKKEPAPPDAGGEDGELSDEALEAVVGGAPIPPASDPSVLPPPPPQL